MVTRLLLFLCLAFGASSLLAQNGNPVVRFQTELGNIDVILLQDIAPNTVANFLRYQGRGAYDNSFIHRSAVYSSPSTMKFVIQGGGYKYINNQTQTIPTDPPIANEFHLSNSRGTLAMAKISGDPNSATSQWFFNESDNGLAPANLDTQNGGFTVFGRIISSAGLGVMDAIGAVPVYNFGSPFNELPLRNYTSGNPVQDANLIHVISMTLFKTTFGLTHPSASTIHLQGVGVPSATYRLETSATPNAAGFTPASMVTADASGNISFDDNSAGSKKFYRLVLP